MAKLFRPVDRYYPTWMGNDQAPADERFYFEVFHLRVDEWREFQGALETATEADQYSTIVGRYIRGPFTVDRVPFSFSIETPTGPVIEVSTPKDWIAYIFTEVSRRHQIELVRAIAAASGLGEAREKKSEQPSGGNTTASPGAPSTDAPRNGADGDHGIQTPPETRTDA